MTELYQNVPWKRSGTNIYNINSGNVGIGITPTAKLHVDGATIINNGLLDLSSGYSIRWGGAASGIVAGASVTDMAFTVGSSERLRVNGSTGYVGIGTNNPQALLSLGSAVTAQKLLLYDASNNRFGLGVATSEMRLFTGSTSKMTFGTISSSDGTTWSEKMQMDNAGNFGIGGTPGAKLHVYSAELRIQTNSAYVSFFNTAGTRRGFVQASETAMEVYSDHATNPLRFWQGATLRASLNATALAMTVPVTTSAGGLAGVGTQSYATTLYTQSRLQNLVTNGNGLLLNNYNFSSFTYDATETHGGGGSFSSTAIQIAYLSDELIPVDPEKYYRLVGWAKSGDTGGANYNATNTQYLGVSPYDIDGLSITPQYYSKVPGSTDTTLALDLNPGDPTMTLTDATGWSVAAAVYTRQMTWWPYTNAKGYTYPNYTYTRNATLNMAGYSTNGLWATTTGISGNVVTLTANWSGPALPAGTPVRNSSSGGTYKYIAASAANVPNAWTRYEGYIGSIDTGGTQNQNQFPYGTAYLKLLFLVNYPTSTGNKIRWSDLWFSEMSSRNLEVATATVPGVVSTGAQTFAGNKSFNGKIGIGNGALDDRGINLAITTATGTNYGIINSVTGASTSNVGYYANISGATTNIGLNIVSTPASSTNYAIYSTAAAKSYFAGSIGLGTTSPTALLHFKAGTATANTAPLKFTSGTNLTTAEAGAMEYDGTSLFFSPSTTRQTVLLDTFTEGLNITLGTTTGTKIGTATTQKLGFYNATPIVQPSAYTQTYATADKTHADFTSADIGAFTGGTEGFLDAAERDNVRTQYNALRADVTDAKQLINSLIDDLQALGLVA